jgi:3'(2'), 5'-bisphosphate nucleotidase
MDDALLNLAADAARKAGKVILSFYGSDVETEHKSDGSPLTSADQASHHIVVNILSQTGISVVSEEGSELCMKEEYYWLVDPLDGTKDFLAGTDEFTVNIALIENTYPILGVVYAPALDELYSGITGNSFSFEHKGAKLDLTPAKNRGLRMATSRFHTHAEDDEFAANNNVIQRIPIGSALKYARIAVGAVDVYPRFVGTSEWDTAAGQAVLEARGGHIIDRSTGLRMSYGKANRRNGSFIAFRAPYNFSDFN